MSRNFPLSLCVFAVLVFLSEHQNTYALGTNADNQNSFKAAQNDNSDFEKIVFIKDEISFAYGYDSDDVNFLPGLTPVKGKTKREYTVFVNVHDGSTVQTTPVFDRVKHKRTFKWLLPYEQALRQATQALRHSHDQSALLTAWTGNQIRTFVSFVLIPKGKDMEFKIGRAAPQKTGKDKRVKTEVRPGGGMQLRLKNLPQGTIILTDSLVGNKNKNTFALEKIFETALKDYNSAHPDKKLSKLLTIPETTYTDDDGYIEESFEVAGPGKN